VSAGKLDSTVTGGATRAESVRAAVAAVPDEAAVIVVHDAARPFIGDDVLERVLAPLGEGWEGAVPALPLADTIKRVRGEEVTDTVDRQELVAAQTPQAFRADVLRTALGGDVAGATDCAALVEAANGRVKVVPGDALLFKVTSEADLALAEQLVQAAAAS
jgi:2-C-methyl-D-erythritol 4-phosphate cytidylyltransferase